MPFSFSIANTNRVLRGIFLKNKKKCFLPLSFNQLQPSISVLYTYICLYIYIHSTMSHNTSVLIIGVYINSSFPHPFHCCFVTYNFSTVESIENDTICHILFISLHFPQAIFAIFFFNTSIFDDTCSGLFVQYTSRINSTLITIFILFLRKLVKRFYLRPFSIMANCLRRV